MNRLLASVQPVRGDAAASRRTRTGHLPALASAGAATSPPPVGGGSVSSLLPWAGVGRGVRRSTPTPWWTRVVAAAALALCAVLLWPSIVGRA